MVAKSVECSGKILSALPINYTCIYEQEGNQTEKQKRTAFLPDLGHIRKLLHTHLYHDGLPRLTVRPWPRYCVLLLKEKHSVILGSPDLEHLVGKAIFSF